MADRDSWCPVCEEPHSADGELRASCPLMDATVRHGVHDTIADAPEPPQSVVVRTGTLIDGRYEVEARVGVGGMGTVYRARDLRTGRVVALKTVNGGFDGESHAAKRFQREATLMAALSHPGVVRVFDFGRVDSQSAYLAMELLSGSPLSTRLEVDGPLETDESCSIACQMLATLSAIHKAGVTHRDLKPSNVFLSDVGSARMVKLLDFGLSRETRESAVRLTDPGTVLGTPHYMSPAMIRGAEPSSRTDVYAVALMLFEMLTGELPIAFGDEPLIRIFQKILSAPRRHPHELNPTLPANLAALLVQATDGDGCFEHAYDFLMAIDATRSGEYMRSEASRLLPPTAPLARP